MERDPFLEDLIIMYGHHFILILRVPIGKAYSGFTNDERKSSFLFSS